MRRRKRCVRLKSLGFSGGALTYGIVSKTSVGTGRKQRFRRAGRRERLEAAAGFVSILSGEPTIWFAASLRV
jgi:hypothetical protein